MSDALIDVRLTLQNILQQLQEEPQRYRLFGIWWWPVKALLRRFYGPENLYMLGAYQDADTAAMVLEENQFNATYPHPAGMVENPDGELVFLFDADAEI
jgi:hypothetical protein